MFDKRTQYSYREQKKQRHRILKYLLLFLILYVFYNCLTAFFFSVWSVDNNSMQPNLVSGDRLLFSSFRLSSFFMSRRNESEDNSLFFKRGNIVLVNMEQNNKPKLPLRIIDGIVRFFTAQRAGIFSVNDRYFVKRVIALPGDEISMTDYVFRVKPKGASFILTEFELSERSYHSAIPQIPSIWNDTLPFSGNMEPIVLMPGECFVISDDRSNTNDSRTWGVIPASFITAKALFRIWPFSKIERL